MIKRRVYLVVTILTELCAAGFWIYYFHGLLTTVSVRVPVAGWVVATALCAVCVYVFKGLRMYLILMEQNIRFARYLPLFLKTTLISIVLPYKLGEVFRAYCFSYAVGSLSCGVISVLVDRFFDTVPLIAFALFLRFGAGGENMLLTPVFLFLLLFLAFSALFYLAYPSTSHYLNRFLLTRTNNSKSVYFLFLLDTLDEWYRYCVALVQGRAIILLVLSFFAWATEYVALYCTARAYGGRFAVTDFTVYLNQILVGTADFPANLYTGIGLLLLTVATGILCINKLQNRGKEK